MALEDSDMEKMGELFGRMLEKHGETLTAEILEKAKAVPPKDEPPKDKPPKDDPPAGDVAVSRDELKSLMEGILEKAMTKGNSDLSAQLFDDHLAGMPEDFRWYLDEADALGDKPIDRIKAREGFREQKEAIGKLYSKWEESQVASSGSGSPDIPPRIKKRVDAMNSKYDEVLGKFGKPGSSKASITHELFDLLEEELSQAA